MMSTQRQQAGVLLPRPATTAAALLCVMAGIALDLAACIAAADGVSLSGRGCIAIAGASTLQVQARVRPSPSHRIPQPAVWHAALPPPAVIRSEYALFGHAAPVTNRQRLAQLTTLRI